MACDPWTTVDEVKAQVEQQIGETLPTHPMVFCGRELDGSSTLEANEICDKQFLQLINAADFITVYVQTFNGEKLALEVQPHDLTGILKERVEDMEGSPREEQRYMIRGVALDDQTE